jgi:hydroxymethylpyrimidine/phosphomethylpyrimidine kinase
MTSAAQNRGRVLVIAGSDSGGGAGIQADIKTVTALGGYAATAITAVTVQDTLGVKAVHPIPADMVEAQARAVLDDLGADAIKTGMLGETDVVEAVARVLSAASVPVVIDPVMFSTSGSVLLDPAALEAFRAVMIPLASVITPNAPEAQTLTGVEVASLEGQRRAAGALLELGAQAVLVKGGHVSGPIVTDLLATAQGEAMFEHPRLDTRHTHGTGCTLASACAVGLAQGLTLAAAVERAIAYTTEAIERAPGFGSGAGPLDHAWPLRERT